ncbi:DNA polymerase III subunit beta [Ancylobacter polymorphus]|uniref:Beta sliding clamp n=1 Tax=Ancylobacter polymorphus TaxID=223390 RepID=A0ABU0B7T8_9HYPH|nr:DNA polymerase III subunit beta [Ancylobacter polymorphus]MDQ0301388.1 DNA polymerase-3 subunit beta [Ancylobacter polymorphus]
MTTTIVSRADLRPAVAIASDIVARRTRDAILANALLTAHPEGGAMLRTTDLDRQVTVRLPEACIDERFATTVPIHALKTVEGKAPPTDHVALDVDAAGGNALDFEGLRVSMAGLPVEQFPEMKVEGEIHAQFDIASAALREGLEAISLAMSTEEARYYLNGVFMHPIPEGGGIRFVATDGHKLALHDIPMEGAGAGWGCIIPRQTVAFLIKVLKSKGVATTARVLVNTVKAAITVGNVDVITKLVEGTYPDYGRVMPREGTTFAVVDRKAMIAAVKAVSAIQSERGRAARFLIEAGRVTLSVSNPEMGRAEMAVPALVTGDELHIGFNSAYVLAILDATDTEAVEFRFGDAGSPAVVQGCGAATRYVVMPMRV